MCVSQKKVQNEKLIRSELTISHLCSNLIKVIPAGARLKHLALLIEFQILIEFIISFLLIKVKWVWLNLCVIYKLRYL